MLLQNFEQSLTIETWIIFMHIIVKFAAKEEFFQTNNIR